MRNQSKVAPGWWDYTTLDRAILDDAARLTEKDILQLSRPGFKVTFYETIQEFYAAEALEYIEAWTPLCTYSDVINIGLPSVGREPECAKD